MPIYEYECTKCSHHFDKRQSFSDEAVAHCPKCHSKSSRIMVPAPVIFKGSGFYVNDYKKPNPCNTANEAGSKPAPSCSTGPACSSGCCGEGSCSSKKD